MMAAKPVLLLAMALAIGAAASASPTLARDRLCLGCHALDRKLVGPAFRDVAARYAAQPDAATRLAERILRGSKGLWGPVPMPVNPRLTAAEARQLAEWVLSLK